MLMVSASDCIRRIMDHPEQEMKQNELPEENLAIYQAIVGLTMISDKKEVMFTLDWDGVNDFYLRQIGVPFCMNAWIEFERTLLKRLNEVKPMMQSKKKKMIARLFGDSIKPWADMKLYKALYPHFDAVLWIGDVAIQI